MIILIKDIKKGFQQLLIPKKVNLHYEKRDKNHC